MSPDLVSITFEKWVNWRVLNEDSGTDEVHVLIKCNDRTIDANPVMLRTNKHRSQLLKDQRPAAGARLPGVSPAT